MAISSPFPSLLGGPTKLEFVFPNFCSSCGSDRELSTRGIHLWRNLLGFKAVEWPAFLIEVPLCQKCTANRVADPVQLIGVKRSFLGKVRKIFLRCANHDFAQAFKAANDGPIRSGWLGVIDGGTGV